MVASKHAIEAKRRPIPYAPYCDFAQLGPELLLAVRVPGTGSNYLDGVKLASFVSEWIPGFLVNPQ